MASVTWPDRQTFGEFVGAVVVVLGAHAPVAARLGLHAQHGIDRGLDEVGDEGRLAALFEFFDGFAGKLVAVVVVGGAVCLASPVGLVLDLAQELLDLIAGQRGIGEIFGHAGVGGLFADHDIGACARFIGRHGTARLGR